MMARFFPIFLALLVANGCCTDCSAEQTFDMGFCTFDIQSVSPNSPDFLGYCNPAIACLENVNCTKAEHRAIQISETCEYSKFYTTDFEDCLEAMKKRDFGCIPEFDRFIGSPARDPSTCDRYNEVLNCIFYEISEFCGDDEILKLEMLIQSNKLEIARMCWPDFLVS